MGLSYTGGVGKCYTDRLILVEPKSPINSFTQIRETPQINVGTQKLALFILICLKTTSAPSSTSVYVESLPEYTPE